MEYTNISFSKTKQAAQYEPETIEVHATLDPKDNLQECAAILKAEVTAALNGKPVNKPAPAKKAVETTTETPVEKPAPKKKAAAAKKPAKKKDVPYDREVKAHKTDFGKILLEVAPTWQKDADLKAKAKGLSTSMAGKPMYSGEGDILDAFKAEIAAGMTASEDDL